MSNNHVIFIHPDGTSPSHYAFARFVDKGPDGRLNWDNLDNAGVYLGHMEDQLGGTSNGGAVTHATGAKVYAESFGLNQDGSPVESLSGNLGKTIMEEAVEANKVTALIQSGAIYEPGTAAFVAKTQEIEDNGQKIVPRSQTADIAKQVIESGVDFIMGGGELNLLPVGTDGFHGTAAELDALSTSSLSRPSENLIELAKSLGYTVVYTEEQLNDLLDPTKYPTPPTKVLGVFAPIHTFNDRPEEVLAEAGLPLYLETAPTVAEMLAVTQKLAESHPNFANGSFTVLEEEGTDNFGNNNNAAGVLEGVRRADAAIGVALDFSEKYSNTLILTAADSDAGGLQIRDPLSADTSVGTIDNNPTLESRPIPLDGQTGADTQPFVSSPDADGDVFNFGVAWAGTPDFSGSIVAKAHGINSEKLPATVDNTGMYELMYETLFDVELAPRNEAPPVAPPATEDTGNVIFIHPDGTSPSHYMALRNIDLGPDGRLNWDNMSNAGVYLGHMENQLTGTSNAGAVTHANGVKVFNESFGLNEDQSQVTPASGKVGMTILEEAIASGKATALIQSGHLAEPGTAAFAAETTNRDGNDIRARDKYAEIIEQVIRSGTNVIMGGGELYMLPIGTTGFHVTPELDASETSPERRPTINLIELAQSLGYTVVYTEEQLNEVMSGDIVPEKLLGVFAADHTFDDRTEEELGLNSANPSPLYVATAPTVAEMLDAALKIVENDPDGFFAVVEEEGTDNFGNNNNAAGTIEAMRRADAAIGVAMDYVNTQDPNTLVVTAADSDAGGMQTFQFTPYSRPSGNLTSDPVLGDTEIQVPFINVNPTTTNDTRNYLDGANGSTASEEFPWESFASVDSLDGPMGNFAIAWAGTPDFPGSIVAKSYGMNADLLPSTLDNTEIYKLMYKTLFGLYTPPDQPAQMEGLNGYDVEPVFTVGEKIGDYVPVGILDGLGAYELNANTVRVFANHELSSELGATYTLANGTELTGARVSYFDIDKETKQVVDAGLAYDTIVNRAGELVDEASDLEFAGIDRLCSAQYVAAHQFGEGRGLEDSLFFTGEETFGGTEFVIDPTTQTMYAVPWMGRAAWENVTELDTGSTEKVALLIGDDREAAPLLLYVGEKDRSEGADLLARNGLSNGKLYAWVPEGEVGDSPTVTNPGDDGILGTEDDEIIDGDTAPDPFGFNGTGNSLAGSWVELDYYRPDLAGTEDYDELGFATQEKQDELFLAAGGFQFSRPEDLATNPEDGTVAVLASTGREERFPEDSWGTTYLIDTDFDESGNPLSANLKILYDGDDAGNGQFASSDEGLRSPDNLDWADNGLIYIQEDRSIDAFGLESGEEASIWRLDPATGLLTRVAQMDRSAIPANQIDTDPTDLGDWESSGILDVSTLFGETPGSLFLFDVEAHSLSGGSITDNNLVQGGQLAFLEAPGIQTELVGFASLPADTFAEGPDSGNFIDTDNRETPFDGQPVQGFSGVQFAPGKDGAFWFLSDNGFGAQDNSADYLLRIYEVTPDFATADGGSGEPAINGFVQLADPNNLIPWDIVNEGTTERFLTGADFDPESIVIDRYGEVWIGDEFGPYLLHFNASGELLEAPIPTPNIVELNTLNGQDPLVIGHRGASGERPEHTLEAYELAIEQGADFIEPDLVITKDGVLIARHEPLLDDTTNVAEVFGEERKSTKMLDGVEVTGYFAEDFTLAEIKQLRAVQSRDYRDQSFNGQFEIPTLEEVIELVKRVETETGKKIGIYPETKHPTFFDRQGLSLEEPLIQTLLDTEFTDPDRIFIQSFEVQNLIELKTELLPAAGLENIPLVQLFGDTTAEADPNDPFSYPYDFVVNAGKTESELRDIYGDLVDLIDFTANPTYKDLANPEVIEYISGYAGGLGPWKNSILLRESLDEPVDGNGDGVAEITTQLTGEIFPLVEWAHDAGLQVHPYTMRNEERFLTLNPDGTPQTPEDEYEQLIQIGFDGYFTDFPETGDFVRDQITQNYVASAQNPDVKAGNLVANLATSRGFEGMAFSPDGLKLYPLLEGTVTGDPEDALRIYEFDINKGQYTDLVGFYGKDDPSYAIGDFTPINNREFLVIERDGGQGESAEFKKIFKIDISQIDENGYVEKEEVADLLNIADPNDLNGDGSNFFDFPFVTIEDVLVIDANTILVANDNNYPFSIGRGPEIDNTEMILLKLPEPLNLSPYFTADEIVEGTILGDTFTGGETSDLINGRQGPDLINGNGGNDFLRGNRHNDTLDGGSGDDRLRGGYGRDLLIGSAGIDILVGGEGADTFVLMPGVGKDIIRDFEDGIDKLGLSEDLTFADLTIETRNEGTTTLIKLDRQLLAVLREVDSVLITEDDFTIV
jgi:glycerophosphoryl diester phosphodiesterase